MTANAGPTGEYRDGVLHLFIPVEPPPGQNARDKLHWVDRSGIRQWWGLLVRNAVRVAEPPFDRAAIQHSKVDYLLVYRTHRRRDGDNLLGSTKPLTDALVTAGVLSDDRLDWVRVEVVEWVDPVNPRVEIEIREV